MSEHDGTTCVACGATWDDVTARYCGRCGAALPVRSASPASGPAGRGDGGSPPAGRRGDRGTRLAVFIALGLIVVAVGIGSTTTMLEGPPDVDEGAVELPDASELPDPGVPDRPQEGCIPEGCELWRVELGAEGWPLLGEGFLVHTTWLEDRPDGDSAADRPVTVTLMTMDGEVAWTREVELAQGRRFGMEGAWPFGDLVLVATADGIVAHAAEDGEVRWVASDLPPGAFVNTHVYADDPIVAVEAESTSRPGDDRSPRVVLARLDRATGAVLWQIDDVATRGATHDLVFVQEDEGDPVAAVDLSTGERRWERPFPEGDQQFAGWWPQQADGRIVFAGGQDVEVVDAATGATLFEFDDLPEPGMLLHLAGNLLTIGPSHLGNPFEPTTEPMAIIDLGSPDPTPRWIEDAVGVMPLVEGDRWLGGIPSGEVEGLAILSVADGDVQVELLDPDGSSRWSRGWEQQGDCCPQLYPGLDTGSLVVAPQDPTMEPARIIATADGEVLDTVRLPADLQPELVSWRGPIATVHGGSARQRAAIVGPGGRFTVGSAGSGGSFGAFGGPDALLVQLDSTLIALDIDVLLGPRASQARQR